MPLELNCSKKKSNCAGLPDDSNPQNFDNFKSLQENIIQLNENTTNPKHEVTNNIVQQKTKKTIFHEKVKDRLTDHGVVWFKSIINQSKCTKLANEIFEQIQNPQDNFGTIQEPLLRKDYPLLIQGTSYEIFKDVLGFVYEPLRDLIGGDAELVEYSSIFTFPGRDSG